CLAGWSGRPRPTTTGSSSGSCSTSWAAGPTAARSSAWPGVWCRRPGRGTPSGPTSTGPCCGRQCPAGRARRSDDSRTGTRRRPAPVTEACGRLDRRRAG
ncbi:MAG: hypothetical protein AVDCRST_MAG07-700, partial [uncultured Frankineae bacterium]